MQNISGYIRYSKKAKKVLEEAKTEAAKTGAKKISSAHILLSILANEMNSAGVILNSLGIGYSLIFDCLMVNGQVNYSSELSAKVKGYDASYESTLSYALFEANVEGSYHVSTYHLLLGICSDTKSIASKILLEMGVYYEYVKAYSFALITSGYTDENFPEEISEEKNSEIIPDTNTKKRKAANDTAQPFMIDLTKKARMGLLDPVIGREKETEQLIRILSRRSKHNPCLIGEPGVGKTAVCEGLALKIVLGEVPEGLRTARIFSLDLSSVIAGAKYRGEFEERLKSVIDKLMETDDSILFIDEIHLITGTGSAEGSMDAAGILKPFLTQRNIRVIGATTYEEYRKSIEKDTALARRFQPVFIEEPDKQSAFEMLLALKKEYEKFHDLSISEEAVRAAVELSARYVPERFLPDKGIDLLDEACAMVKIYNSNNAIIPNVQKKDIITVLSSRLDMPLDDGDEDEKESLAGLENKLMKNVVGQDEAVKKLSAAVKRYRTGFTDPNKPASFLFVGPTGVGKTKLCKILAENIFGGINNLIEYDMSEFSEKHSVSRLIGSPPGYVGYEDGSALIKAVAAKPNSVIVFDEIEKAHPDVFDVFLQMLENGRLTDGSGKTADLKNTIIIMTSNIGFGKKNDSYGFEGGESVTSADINKELKKIFRPEFINRIDEIIPFNKLGEKELSEIFELIAKEFNQRLVEQNICLIITEKLKSKIISENISSEYGARPLKRAFVTNIVDKLSEEYLSGKIKKGAKVTADLQNDGVIFVCRA